MLRLDRRHQSPTGTDLLNISKNQVLAAVLVLFTFGCNMQAEKNQYILGERLFNDQKYTAAIEEFKKIVDRNPRSTIAQQSIYRMAVIQSLYIEQYDEAVKSFRQFSLLSSNKDLVYEAEKNIAEIFFSKKEDYRAALEQYKRLISQFGTSKEIPFFLFRLAKSYYGILDFGSAISTYRKLIIEHPKSEYLAEAEHQIGNTYFTQGDCDAAIKAFQQTIQNYPKSPQAVFSQFSIGNCYEETNHLDEAIKAYEAILELHPAKEVVQAKLKRLKEKKDKRN